MDVQIGGPKLRIQWIFEVLQTCLTPNNTKILYFTQVKAHIFFGPSG